MTVVTETEDRQMSNLFLLEHVSVGGEKTAAVRRHRTIRNNIHQRHCLPSDSESQVN